MLLEPDQLLPALTTAPDLALEFLSRAGEALRLLGRANVWCRLQLGRQLLAIQERQLWTQMRRPDGSGDPYHSWDDFLSHGFPTISGFGRETCYAAVSLVSRAE